MPGVERANSEKLKIVFIALLQWHHQDHRSALSKLGSKTLAASP
jgi:hypothetical protein